MRGLYAVPGLVVIGPSSGGPCPPAAPGPPQQGRARRSWTATSPTATIRPVGPKFAFYGHHKCASLWIIRILQELCRRLDVRWLQQDHCARYPPQMAQACGEASGFFLLCWNSDYYYVRELPCRAFHIIRDPRDILVSGYFSHLNSHPQKRAESTLRPYRSYLRTLDKDAGLFAEMDYSSPYFQHLFRWQYDNPLILETRFEQVTSEPGPQFRRILSHLGIRPGLIADDQLDAILKRQSFERITGGRRPGEENPKHHFRKGVSGDWRCHFTEAHVEHFKRLYNPVLLKTGYEQREDWALDDDEVT